MNQYFACTPVRKVYDHENEELKGVRPNETTWINAAHIAYAIADEWIAYPPDFGKPVHWEIAQVVMADGTHFNVLLKDWQEWLA